MPSATSLILEALRIIPIPDVMSSSFQELQVCTHGTTGYAPWLLNPQPPSQYFRNEFLFNILHCGIWADQCLLRMRMWTLGRKVAGNLNLVHHRHFTLLGMVLPSHSWCSLPITCWSLHKRLRGTYNSPKIACPVHRSHRLEEPTNSV